MLPHFDDLCIQNQKIYNIKNIQNGHRGLIISNNDNIRDSHVAVTLAQFNYLPALCLFHFIHL